MPVGLLAPGVGMGGGSVATMIWTLRGGIHLHTAVNHTLQSAYFDASFRATSGTVYARLYDKTAAAAVTDSEVSTASATLNRQRSSALTLTDGHEYRAQTGQLSSDAGKTTAAGIAYV